MTTRGVNLTGRSLVAPEPGWKGGEPADSFGLAVIRPAPRTPTPNHNQRSTR